MDKVSLYRKYRPNNFDNLIGQDHVKTTLINAFKSGRTAHAYLLTGPRGTGKTSTARLIAKALNCDNLQDGFEPCDECSICLDINSGCLIDLVEIDAASNRGIDEVRDLKEKINFAPSHAKYKVYIIDEVHMMTNEAFNALLKTLEEPPAHAYFILATTEVHKIPDTIISRCQRFDFRRISEKAILTRLSYIAQKEEIEAEEKALLVLSKYVNGGLRDAIGLLEQLTNDNKLSYEHVHEILGVTDIALLDELFEILNKNDLHQALRIVNDLYSQGSDLQQFLHEFIDLLRVKLLESVEESKPEDTGKTLKMIKLFQEALKDFNPGLPQLALEIALIKITDAYAQPVAKAIAPPVAQVEEVAMEAAPVAAASVEAAPVAQAPEIDSPVDLVVSDGEIGLDEILKHWPRVTERVKQPPLKMSLKNAKLINLTDVTLTLQFSSNFHQAKVMEHDNRIELENILMGIYGHGFKLASTVKELDIQPVIQDNTPPPSSPPPSAVAHEALEIFGGEFVD